MDYSMLGKLIIRGYNVNIWWSNEDNCYLAEVLELPGCMADAKTLEELYKEVEEHIEMWKEVNGEW